MSAPSGQTTFASTIVGLQLSTTYFIRSYATNAVGVAYGNQVTFTTAGLASAWDWRNVNGTSYVTPVKNIGQTSECWAAAPIDIIESRMMIEKNAVVPTPSFSWQDVANNALGPTGQLMTNGGYPYYSLLYCQQTGALPNAGGPRVLIKSCALSTIFTAATLKSEIETNGPVTANFELYASFCNYSNGIYDTTSANLGTAEGTTTVTITGYNDAGQYWIIKNNWGPTWGESGYFQVDYTFAATTGGLFSDICTAVVVN